MASVESVDARSPAILNPSLGYYRAPLHTFARVVDVSEVLED